MSSGGLVPARWLAALTALVLALHAWVLQGGPMRVQRAAASSGAAFVVRRIDPPAAGAPAADARATSAGRPAVPPRRGRVRAAPALPVAAPAAGGQPPQDEAAVAARASAVPIAVPGAVRMEYAVTAQRGPQLVRGVSELAWSPVEDGYEASFAVVLDGLPSRRQHSAGQLGAAGLEPRRFAEIGRGEQAAHFERDGSQVIFSNNRPAARLLAGAQDRLSVLVQLGAMLAGDPGRYPPGTQIAIQTATTREALPWRFEVKGQEQLELAGGHMTTVKLERPPQAQYDQRMEIWFAPGKAYVPVRLRLTQPNGDWVDHQWSGTDRR